MGLRLLPHPNFLSFSLTQVLCHRLLTIKSLLWLCGFAICRGKRSGDGWSRASCLIDRMNGLWHCRNIIFIVTALQSRLDIWWTIRSSSWKFWVIHSLFSVHPTQKRWCYKTLLPWATVFSDFVRETLLSEKSEIRTYARRIWLVYITANIY